MTHLTTSLASITAVVAGALSATAQTTPRTQATVQGSTVSSPQQRAPVAAMTPAPPPGPAPTNLFVYNSQPGVQVLSWTKPQLDNVSFRVMRQVLPNTQWVTLTKPLTPYPQLSDTIALAQNSATYRVVAVYPDGREGVAEKAFPNPTPLASPTHLQAQQVGEGRIFLRWDSLPGAHGYRIYGSGQPADGKLVTRASDTVSGVPLGNQSLRVAGWYFTAASAGAPSVSVNVMRWTAQYRVILTGFHVNRETGDDMLNRDGVKDEVYAGAHVMVFVPDGIHSPPPLHNDYVVRSMVYGDNSKWPYRVRAGSATPMGGLKAGDNVPANPSAPVTTLAGVQFPMQVWAGTITANREIVVISPSLWEQDGDTTQFHLWWWGQRNTATNGTKLAASYVNEAEQSNELGLNFLFNLTTGYPTSQSGDAGNGADRAIGLSSNYLSASPMLMDRGLIFTQERVERILCAAGVSRIVFPVRFVEGDNTGDPGDYILYIQVERIP